MPTLIDISDLSFSYPRPDGEPIPALRDLTFRIEEGEYLAIIGANGSGKSTLARHLNALLIPSAGRVLVAGMDTRSPANHTQIRDLVGMVLQYPEDQIVATTVEEDVAFGPENMGLPPQQIRQRVEMALKATGMWEHRKRPPYLLSAGQMQRVALAGALARRPRCLVFDEATAMLDPKGRHSVLEMMDRLNQDGLTVVAITHFMAEAVRADRVIVLSQGRIVLHGAPELVFSQESTLQEVGLDLPPAAQVARILRRKLPEIPTGIIRMDELAEALPVYPQAGVTGEGSYPVEPSVEAPDQGLIDVEGLGHIYLAGTPLAQRALNGASLRVRENSVHGILGATGSGKSTLLQHLNGLLYPQEGRIRVGQFQLNNPELDVKALRRLVGLVFQIPETQFFEQYVGDEIAFGPRQLGSLETLRADVRWAMELVGLDFETFRDRLIYTLSGGERRKVALASLLAIKPRILLLDEPMAGLDPASRADLTAKFKGFQSEGMTLVLSSHYMEDISALAERITVFSAGKDVLSGSLQDVFSQVEALQALDLEPPVVTQVAEGLRQRGWPLPVGIISAEILAEILERLIKAQKA